MYKIIIIIITVILLSGCKSFNNEFEISSNKSYESEKNSVKKNKKNTLSIKIPCQSNKSPPIKDKGKIKQLLIKTGVITDAMSSEDIDRAVNEYIRKKQKAYTECKI